MYGARNSASAANIAVTSAGEPPASASSTGPPVSTTCAISWPRRGAGQERERGRLGPRRARCEAQRRRPQHGDKRPGDQAEAVGDRVVHAARAAAPPRGGSAAAFSATRLHGHGAANRPRPPRPPRTTPIGRRAEGHEHDHHAGTTRRRGGRAGRGPARPARRVTRPAATTTASTRPARAVVRRPRRPAATLRVIQCCSGKVNAAPGEAPTSVQSTDTGAAASAPRPRVISANSSVGQQPADHGAERERGGCGWRRLMARAASAGRAGRRRRSPPPPAARRSSPRRATRGRTSPSRGALPT